MKAMVLCAGKGTRLRPLTLDTPKPMIPLVDKPVMQYIVEHLHRHGVSDIAVNLSYLPEKIHDFFRDGAQFGVNMFYSYEGDMSGDTFIGAALGSAGGMRKIQDETGFFDDTFIVLCGDAAVNLDISRLVRQHKERKSLASIVLKNVSPQDVYKYGVVALDENGRISQFQEKPDPTEAVSTLANTGIYIFEPEIFNFIPEGCTFDLGSDLFPRLCAETDRFFGAVDNFDWIDIGNLRDFNHANAILLSEPPDLMAVPGREVQPGLRLGPNVSIDLSSVQIEGPVYIGGGTVIEHQVKIFGPTVIGQNCHIRDHAVIHRSILGDHTGVHRNTLLTNAIVYGGYLVNEGGGTQRLDAYGAVHDARQRHGDCSAQHYAVADLNLINQIISSELPAPAKKLSA